jgi:hypothetical protein
MDDRMADGESNRTIRLVWRRANSIRLARQPTSVSVFACCNDLVNVDECACVMHIYTEMRRGEYMSKKIQCKVLGHVLSGLYNVGRGAVARIQILPRQRWIPSAGEKGGIRLSTCCTDFACCATATFHPTHFVGWGAWVVVTKGITTYSVMIFALLLL